MNQPWYCTQCGKENHPNSYACHECRTPRPPHTYPQGEGTGTAYGPPPQGYTPPPPLRKSNAVLPAIITCAAVLLVVLVAGTCVAISLPNYIKVKEKAKEAEVKANLHNIQLGVERFAVDTEGVYPHYLIGGETKCALSVLVENKISEAGNQNIFDDINDCTDIKMASDPLLREGYIDSYPRNPFTRNGAAIHSLQANLQSTPAGMDHLRNGCESGLALGTRFGPYCTSMGSVLADMRFAEDMIVLPDGSTQVIDTGADTEYVFWDMWQGDEPQPYVPGMFFYKGAGPIVAKEGEPQLEDNITPSLMDQYILGAYGGTRNKGEDVLGPEMPIIGSDGSKQWTYLRSEVSTDPGHVEGCPYSFEGTGENTEVMYGNPNGIRDAVILMLTAGEDFEDY